MSELKPHHWLPFKWTEKDPEFPQDEGIGFLGVQLPVWMCNSFGIPQDKVFDWGGFYSEFGLIWVGSLRDRIYDDREDVVSFEHCWKITNLNSLLNWVPASESDMIPFEPWGPFKEKIGETDGQSV